MWRSRAIGLPACASIHPQRPRVERYNMHSICKPPRRRSQSRSPACRRSSRRSMQSGRRTRSTSRLLRTHVPPATGLELWVIDVAASSAHRVGTVKLNAVLGRTPCEWMPDSPSLLCKVIPATARSRAEGERHPGGPGLEENLGKVSPAPTFEDMLKTPTDETIFEYYATSQLARCAADGCSHASAGEGYDRQRRSLSPDGKYALVSMSASAIQLYVSGGRFPMKTEIVTLKGGAAKLLQRPPAVDNLPISRDAVEPGPRDYQWRARCPGDGGLGARRRMAASQRKMRRSR